MNFNIRGDNIEVTPALRNYSEKKVSKLERYFDGTPNSDVYINLKVFNNEQLVEVTIPMPGLLLRAEESHDDMYAAIDLVVEKLERQIRKHKTKVNRKFRQGGAIKFAFANGNGNVAPSTTTLLEEEEDEDEFQVVRNKRFDLKPMDTQEAILQMDMLGHNFFVFSHAESGETNVVYKRKDGKYGLIAPDIE
ncbi:ribosome hibernation-promoting factor, HPF/YfiA family [Pseudalkalibacillus salsuginis]|uniref:ribosome hibernation-promoting factor, HPF/YfiA family n=1 Tax=Pseudalkalibacillus salsuginis TaxID=2910972 RepID=UPI001F300AB8|nr:ribosome-associated translation inhibitor RaiA [Pseudalkalibacillus salsuginis]MCF6410161.1 ribosome-associated translation inhibitor RaiA [Pseudalkalibacillus salsuginis]